MSQQNELVKSIASINAIQKKTNYLNDNSNGHQVNVPDHSGTLNQIKDGIQNFRLEITQMLNNSKVSYALQIIIMHTFGNLETFFNTRIKSAVPKYRAV